jgi:HK97 family phage prohead protease
MADKPSTNQIERRTVPGDIRAVKKSATDPTTLSGYAALFGRETVIDGWFPFREVIRAGAFAETIKADDVRCLFNHSADHVLGRTTNGTLRLFEDAIGLHYEVDLNPDDSDALSVGAKVARLDVSQSSFAFQVEEDTWDESEVKLGKLPLRTIIRVSPLFDVSPVTYPAYADSTVSARAEARAKALTPARSEARATSTMTPDHMETIQECIADLASVLAESKMMKMPADMPSSTEDEPTEPMTNSFTADPDTRAREMELRRRERR